MAPLRTLLSLACIAAVSAFAPSTNVARKETRYGMFDLFRDFFVHVLFIPDDDTVDEIFDITLLGALRLISSFSLFAK